MTRHTTEAPAPEQGTETNVDTYTVFATSPDGEREELTMTVQGGDDAAYGAALSGLYAQGYSQLGVIHQ